MTGFQLWSDAPFYVIGNSIGISYDIKKPQEKQKKTAGRLHLLTAFCNKNFIVCLAGAGSDSIPVLFL